MGACPFLRAGFWGLGGGQRRGWAGTEGFPAWVGGWRPAAPAAGEKFAHTERLGSEPPPHPPTPPLTLTQEERKEKQ